MNISSVSNTVRSFPKKIENNNNNVSFKSIYIDKNTDLGRCKAGIFPARFQKKDALLLNEIAQRYPNQDCFIRKGYGGRPYLEFREKPVDVQVFEPTMYKQYKVEMDPNDKENPCVPLILTKDTKNLNYILGVPSYISTNPSLQYTIKAGFEVHKKLLERKYQIMDVIGRTDTVDFGGDTLTEKAHQEIQEVEIAVTRFLLECAYAALTDKASGRQIYESKFPKAQSRLDANRRLDLTTSYVKQKAMNIPSDDTENIDICEVALRNYPKIDENRKKIDEILAYMTAKGITLENSEDID